MPRRDHGGQGLVKVLGTVCPPQVWCCCTASTGCASNIEPRDFFPSTLFILINPLGELCYTVQVLQEACTRRCKYDMCGRMSGSQLVACPYIFSPQWKERTKSFYNVNTQCFAKQIAMNYNSLCIRWSQTIAHRNGALSSDPLWSTNLFNGQRNNSQKEDEVLDC